MYLDGRRYNTPVWSLTPPQDWSMRVPQDILRSVVFLGSRDPDNQASVVYTDTAFFVSVPTAITPTKSYTYLVTSAHGARKLGNDFMVRINRRDDGAAEDVPSGSRFKWYFHPTDHFVDVALSPLNVPTTQYEYLSIPRSMFWMPEKVREGDSIGLGDETFVAGLFSELANKHRNSPILHFGNLIALPSEKIVIEIEDNNKGLADAYLVEVRSIRGLSGSPVFLSKPMLIDMTGILGSDKVIHMATGEVEETPPKFYATGPFCFLGLMHGHWKYPLGEMAKFFPAIEDGLHSGVAVVVPARKIAEVLDHPDLIQFRKIGDERLRKEQIQNTPVPARDSANKPNTQPTTPREGEPVEIPVPRRKAFFSDLEKATQRKKPSE